MTQTLDPNEIVTFREMIMAAMEAYNSVIPRNTPQRSAKNILTALYNFYSSLLWKQSQGL